MNSLEMVEENLKTADASRAGDFTAEDEALIGKVRELIRSGEKVGCTACRYCMPCPKGVDIPGIFRCYNTMYTEGKREGRFQFAQTVGMTGNRHLRHSASGAASARATARSPFRSGKS